MIKDQRKFLLKFIAIMLLVSAASQASYPEIHEDAERMSRKISNDLGRVVMILGATGALLTEFNIHKERYYDHRNDLYEFSLPDTLPSSWAHFILPSYSHLLFKVTVIGAISKIITTPFTNSIGRMYSSFHYSRLLHDTRFNFRHGNINPLIFIKNLIIHNKPSLKSRINNLDNDDLSESVYSLLYVLHHKRESTMRGIPQLNRDDNSTDMAYDCGDFHLFLTKNENIQDPELLDFIFPNQAQTKVNYFRNKMPNSYILEKFNHILALSNDKKTASTTSYKHYQLRNRESCVIDFGEQFYIGITDEHKQ